MSQQTSTTTAPEVRQQRIARYLSLAFENERWTVRKLSARTGIGRNAVAARLNGDVALSFGDIELFADVLRKDPEYFYGLLRRISEMEELPGLDSNQEPIGSQLAPVSRLSDHQSKPRDPKPRGAAAGEVIALRLAK